jgi:hypothetical protein
MAIFRPIPRRTLLRGAGAALALPLLDVMTPTRARAQATANAQKFIAFFYPNGTDPGRFNPVAGPLTPETLSECLVDLAGFEAEGIWPAESATYQDITVVTGINHSGVCMGIHDPSMSLSAFKGTTNNYTPPQPTLDQMLAEHLQGDQPFRNLSLSSTGNSDIGQGHISFRGGEQPETVIRSPRQAFDLLFAGVPDPEEDAQAAAQRMARKAKVIDLVREDAARLNARVSAGDRVRLDQYFSALSELETQLGSVPQSTCQKPAAPPDGGDWHQKSKLFIDLSVLAFACDLTNVVTVQYSDSWGVHYSDYTIGSGIESLGSWSDHFISHKLDDTDRATDLDGLARAEAQRIANLRVVQTSRFKARRFSYLVNSLKRVETPTGTLLDDTLALYVSENGDGDSHGRANMPILLSGHAGGFQTGRTVAATNQPTGALHASILNRFGMEFESYGDPVGTPIAGL